MSHPALHTPLVDLLDCELPIMGAGMGGVARHELAAAISNAGGFGCLGMVREPVARIREEILAYRRLSQRPFAVNLIPAATEPALLEAQVSACLDLGVGALVLFWDVDTRLVERLKGYGVLVIHQVGTLAQARIALDAGVDVLIAQGVEAGGHVHGLTSLVSLLPEVVATSTVPVVASGGVASGQALAAVLALGAQGASCGSAFLATHEANVHPHHQQRLLQAGADDTVLTRRFFRNWPMPAPVRVLRNAVTEGRHETLYQQRATPAIGTQDDGPVYLFSTDSPLRDFVGTVDDMALYAGQSCGQIAEICSAGERLHQMCEEAAEVLQRVAATEAAPPAASRRQDVGAPDAAMVEVLQELLAAERAGARVAVMSLRDASDPAQRALIEQVRQGEAESCRRLTACLRYAGVEPTRDIGAFYGKAMAIADLGQRLPFVDKGQRWVIRRLQAYLPECRDAYVREHLEQMLRVHEINSEAMQQA